MVLAYSHSEWFVPSLQDLIDPEKISPRRCVWHKSRRSPKSDGAQLVKCSCRIAEQDAKKADQLLRNLRDGFDNETRCLRVLRVLSPLLLCKNIHRALNVEAVFDSWTTEWKLNARNPTGEASTQNARPSSSQHQVRKITAVEVLERLGITTKSPIQCHGRGKRIDHCGNWISRSNGERIGVISRELAGDWCLSNTVLKVLEELSGLVMCQLWHQDQAPSKLKEWITIMEYKEASKKPQFYNSAVHPQTPIRQSTRYSTIDTPETQTSPVWTSPRRSRTPLSTATTPDSILPSGSPTHPLTGARHREQSCVSPTPISSRTRSNINNGPDQSAASATNSFSFEPLSTTKSPLKAAEYVMEKIKEKISTRELLSGFVYGFRRPGCDLIKIGTTTTKVAERMRRIATQCNYTPIVVFEVATKYAMKVEHLVHRQLYRQNRRECMIDSLCNGGRGCASRHKEWFEGVSDMYAEAVVRAWVRWINLEPYDAEGFLKPAWIIQTKLFNLNATGDIWMRWTEIALVKVPKEEPKEEAINVAIKAEKVLRTARELSSQLAPPKSKVSTTLSEIREVIPAPGSFCNSVAVLA